MAVDWLTIRNDYINGGGSYRKLAEKYGITLATIRRRAEAENWIKLREEHQHKINTKAAQKAQEKISDALSDEAASKVRIRVRLLEMGENWLNNLEEITDTGEFRRMVQSFADMGVFEKDVSEYAQGNETEDDPLTKALKEEAERLNNENSE